MKWDERALDPQKDEAERRVTTDRRQGARGGRRRADWPDDAGMTGCPRCGFAHPQLMSTSRTEYRWACAECGSTFATRRATRVAL
jgi:ribosomal protein S27AE